MTKEERLIKQKERLVEMKVIEEELHAEGYKLVAGVDEVGRGPLAGPVVTAAVILPEDFDVLGVDDSKKISEKKREQLFDEIREKAVAYGIGMADQAVIDDINILQATKRAMVEALANLEQSLEDKGITGSSGQHKVDYVLFDALTIDKVERPQRGIIKGDSKALAIAAASIIAKVTRDRMMIEYAEEYPHYAFEKNKGYGTKAHYEGIKEHGVCPIHRMSFLKNLY